MSLSRRRSLHGRHPRPTPLNASRQSPQSSTVSTSDSQFLTCSDEGILILAGGLTIHTFKEFDAWNPVTAPQGFKDWERAIVESVSATTTVAERNTALRKL